MSARVLVVDDIAPNVKLLEAKLMSEYYDVITATSGPQALERVKADTPDIVLLDVMMPGMDGFEVCRAIKADPTTAHIPVVMVTALTDATDRVRGLEAGADDFLSKPVNDVALMARVRSLVRLKMTVDEWRARENTATTLGVSGESAAMMAQATENANILIVEDQAFEAQKCQEALSRDQHKVFSVTGGLAALERASVTDCDLIIVSLNMEKEDGLRLCSHLRSNDRTRAVPILMLGQEQDLPKIARGLEIGANDYILRPMDRNELLARVRTQIRRKRFQERLKANYEVSLSMALTDTLTGLYNRRYLNVHLEKLLNSTGDQRKPIAVLLFDLDKFKSINDTYGHGVGDEVLKTFADRLKTRMRGFDLLARTGGEEFVAVLVDVSLEKACFIAERLRRAVGRRPMPVNTPEGQLTVTTSLGGAYIGTQVVSVEDALNRADEQLYKAKESGRDAVVFERVGKLDPAQYDEPERAPLE
ncbi:MAG: PleD family two-component system response regulator [Rhodospirillales bacterium]|nr:PleD family two-component system response regulator [Rhodospirillales bacterium]USO08266.1 MAG: PleD family two-component system response regulator [Rhodospirillales bacterium]